MSGISLQNLSPQGKRWESDRSLPSLAALGHETFDYIQHKNYVLRFLQKKEVAKTRPVIPATQSERFSFLRSYLCSPIKEQIFFLQNDNTNTLLWSYILSAVAEEVPYTYTILFLSIYCPRVHLYSSKMFPLAWGCSIQVIITAVVELLYVSDFLALIFDYAIKGVFAREPWSRCEQNTYKINGQELNCFGSKEFYKLTNLNKTVVTNDYNYRLNENYFQVSHIIYYKLWNWGSEKVLLYSAMLWIGAALFYKQFFKNTLWKTIDCLIWLITAVYFVSWFYIKIHFEPSHINTVKVPENALELKTLTQAMVIAVTINSPPVIHLLSARGNNQPEPGRDSILYSLSRFLFDCFQVLVYNRLKNACEITAGVRMQIDAQNSYPLFFVWPLFFENFVFGPLFTKAFFLLFFLWQYTTFIITYHCLVEVIVCEWKKIKRHFVLIALTILVVVTKSLISHEFLFFLYLYCKVVTYMTELAVIHWCYPIGRLLEDISFFYYGRPRSWIRTISIKTVPYFVFVLILCVFMQFAKIYPVVVKDSPYLNWVWFVPISPVFFGAIYITIQTVFVLKQKWSTLITPRPKWGPKEHIVRQFRKQYDDRDFIDSMGPRFLNRHMLKRAEAPNYRLGVQYDLEKRRGTVDISKDKFNIMSTQSVDNS